MNSNSKSLAADLSRIVLLGIAFDVSRFVARECCGALTSRLCRDDNSSKESREDTAVSTFAFTGFIERCKFLHMDRIRRLFSKRHLGLFVYLLLPPPLLIYGAWDYLLCKNKVLQRPINNSTIFGGVYFTSVVTSFGLLLWICPELLSWGDDAEVDDDDKITKKEDGLTKKSFPSLIFRQPLVPDSSNELERRPRSDSIRSVMSEECSVNTQTINTPIVEKTQKRYLEILVHNVSHTDLILGLSCDQGSSSMMNRAVSDPFPADFEDTPRKNNASPRNNTNEDEEEYIMCRPRFSAFDLFSRRVLSELQGQMKITSSEASSTNKHPLLQKIISYPRYERSSKTARHTLVTPRPSDQTMLPVGFNLERDEGINNTAVDPCEMQSLRLRGRDIPKVDPYLLGETPRRMTQLQNIHSPPIDEQSDLHTPRDGSMQDRLRINAVFFPLLATLLPRWLGRIADKFGDEDCGAKKLTAPLHTPNVKKVVFLVSGVGTPRNWTHSISGNSTQTCAEIMELFIHVLYPDVTVIRIHSETNIFRYDENITFATQELMPVIDSYRDAHARGEPYPDEKSDDGMELEKRPFDPDWRQTVSVAYSFADGSAARSHAIQAALRLVHLHC